MADEAVKVELCGNEGDVIQYECADGLGIAKGAFVYHMDNRTVTGSKLLSVTASNDLKPFAGIAAMEKVASDGSTRISVWQNGIFNIKCSGAACIPKAGQIVMASGSNLLDTPMAAIPELFTSGGFIVGTVLSTAAAQDTVPVRMNL